MTPPTRSARSPELTATAPSSPEPEAVHWLATAAAGSTTPVKGESRMGVPARDAHRGDECAGVLRRERHRLHRVGVVVRHGGVHRLDDVLHLGAALRDDGTVIRPERALALADALVGMPEAPPEDSAPPMHDGIK